MPQVQNPDILEKLFHSDRKTRSCMHIKNVYINEMKKKYWTNGNEEKPFL